MLSFLLLIHVCGAVIGLLSGYLAMILRKGSGLHRASGTIFFGSMLIMSACAAYVAFARGHLMNGWNSVFTFYLVATGWLAARRVSEKVNLADVTALLAILLVAAGNLTLGIEAANSATGRVGGYPAVLYFVFGTIAVLHAQSDIRMLLRGGVSGSRRVVRHLWRMALALLFATLSLYPGQPRFFPQAWRESPLIYTPHILLFASMIFYVVRVRLSKPPASAGGSENPRLKPGALNTAPIFQNGG